MFTCSGI